MLIKVYIKNYCIEEENTQKSCEGQGSRVAQRSKAFLLSARGVTTDSGLIPGCITTGRDWEPHRVAHNWPSVVQVRVWPG